MESVSAAAAAARVEIIEEAVSEQEREEAERLHRRAVAAEAMAAARSVAKERGVLLKKEEASSFKAERLEKPAFMTKAQRQAAALARVEAKRKERQATLERESSKRRGARGGRFNEPAPLRDAAGAAQQDAARLMLRALDDEDPAKGASKNNHLNNKRKRSESKSSSELTTSEQELRSIRETYLGTGGGTKKRIVKPSEKFARIFQFDWDAGEDTSADLNPLYARRHAVQPLLGRGYVAGLDMREQRKAHNFAQVLAEKRQAEERALEEAEGVARAERKAREARRKEERDRLEADLAAEAEKVATKSLGKALSHWSEKKLEEMTERDWRIFKEDFDIRVRGGRAPAPLRTWEEAEIRDEIRRAIRDLGFKEPSPIQRQAIPVGLEQRDIIGVAETGSGKTAAFAIPMLDWVARLPSGRISHLADDGPLGLVMAPTRELANQINEEIGKLAKYMNIKSCTVVGGANVEDQAFRLREGVELVVGTPGRLNDCLETQYLVLNQANYVVLDECDRMLDMGFEPQVTAVLEAMGGLLKSEDEGELERQEEAAKRGEAWFRITCMFSATMPPPVEKLARRFMRMPAIVAIGDEDSNKNKRIAQRVVYTTDAAKKNALVDLLRRKTHDDDKILVFCNEKKSCDLVGKFVQAAGLRCAIIHGGKSQDSRDYALEQFKQGAVTTLIATDVAGRGLDIPNVAHVVNFDMSLKIDSYCHRIGRTGRAGKDGIATTFLTDADEAIMYELRQYLEQTDAEIPPALDRHPAARAKPGERNDRGELLTARASKGNTQFLKEDKFDLA
ncbi:hypothetical protein CTAYLR_007890 [Chrysophaeum taylorii]|uniref:RNA helicase n=1 Tax=Chrysophaeum taylorii TaxID=2483200 RepID=A0AAD7UM21_9STRA|nr:hypothetical protein CTAYLR_007890 [Chrysophaeum taylorii]